MNYLSYTISEFLKLDIEPFLGALTDYHGNYHYDLASTQTVAWKREFDDLKRTLVGMEGRIIFEYRIPELGKVIDVLLLIKDKIFVLEYKVNAVSYEKADINQTNGYALRLKFFQSNSNNNWIIPILIATDAPEQAIRVCRSDEDMVCNTILCNSGNLLCALKSVEQEIPAKSDDSWIEGWTEGTYKPSPTIIEAAKHVWEQNNVRGLAIGESSIETRLEAEAYIVQKVIPETKNRASGKNKSICFVTGVPGAGKTLVGLNTSVALQSEGASMLSGNGPLVDVLTAALRRDIKDNKNNLNCDKKSISVDSIIRSALGYKQEIFRNRLDYKIGEGSVNLKENATLSSQHVIIFDEAQRAWTQEKMIRPGQTGKKTWQENKFPFSEPELLLWDMNQLKQDKCPKDWGVMICLVGGGQEIHDGEAGICEWLKAITENNLFKNWHVYMAKAFSGPEYDSTDGSGMTIEAFRSILDTEKRLTLNDALHLNASQRSIRSDQVSALVQEIINCNAEKAKSIYDEIKDKFHIYLTQDIDKAKQKLRQRKNQLSNLQDIRIGMLMSSNAKRLRPYGYPCYKGKNVASWFLDDDSNINSSNFLEVALDEFSVQGLELDIAAVMWDADLRYDPNNNTWTYHEFNGKKWSDIKDEKITGREKSQKKVLEKEKKNRKREIKRNYMRNAYRVLLTRSRTDMVIFVPKGSEEDENGKLLDITRNPKNYKYTYQYLKDIGFTVI